MTKILLINGGVHFAHSGGQLNETLHQYACKHLKAAGHDVKETEVKNEYDLKEEVQKTLWSEIIIYQMPGWWMMTPWQVKKYMDEVYTEGHGALYESDGRTRSNPAKQYGTGGLLQGRHYMLSVTWNAPIEAFNEVGNFFDARGVDGVYFPFHKAQQFLGMKNLPTFMVNDVMKDPQIDLYLEEYKNHLNKVIA